MRARHPRRGGRWWAAALATAAMVMLWLAPCPSARADQFWLDPIPPPAAGEADSAAVPASAASGPEARRVTRIAPIPDGAWSGLTLLGALALARLLRQRLRNRDS